jgi:murein DD-endopeptidase MepM/ murein hydrolase activator NlpD
MPPAVLLLIALLVSTVSAAGSGTGAVPLPATPYPLTPASRPVLVSEPGTVAPAAPSRRPHDLAGPSGRFGWPVSPHRIVRRFDPPPRPWLPGHRGVDFAAPPVTVVHAAGSGTVVYAGVIAGRGVVSVAHPGGLRTTYEPVASTVAVGDAVAVGSVLGTLTPGHPGCAEAACLHWGLRRGDAYLDPLTLLGLGRVRLLPLEATW